VCLYRSIVSSSPVYTCLFIQLSDQTFVDVSLDLVSGYHLSIHHCVPLLSQLLFSCSLARSLTRSRACSGACSFSLPVQLLSSFPSRATLNYTTTPNYTSLSVLCLRTLVPRRATRGLFWH